MKALANKTKTAQSNQPIERKIAEHLQVQIDQFLQFWVDPKIAAVHWTGDNLEISITLPFWFPLPTGEDGDYLATKTDCRKFRSTIKKQYLEHMRSEKLSNLLFAEYGTSVQKHIGVFQFGKSTVAELSKIAERRLAGRPVTTISEKQLGILRRELKRITELLREVKARIPEWKTQFRGRKESSLEKLLKNKIRDYLSIDELPWNRFLFVCFEQLPWRVSFKGAEIDRKLSAPQSWSPSAWAVRIVQEMHYRQTGILVPASKLLDL